MLDWLVSEVRETFQQPERARFALDLSSRRIGLVERTRNGPITRGVADHGAPDFEQRVGKLRRIASRAPSVPPRVDLLLPVELTLYRIDTFPSEAAADLRREAWWRLERWAPYRPEELCYDLAVLESDPRTGFISVAAVMAPRDIVEEAVAHARQWGFQPQRVSVAADFEGFPNGPLFLEASEDRAVRRAMRRRAAMLTLAALVVAGVGAYRGVSERQREARAAEARLAQVQAESPEAEALRAATLELAARSVRPGAARDARRLAVEQLRAIAEAMPEGAVIDELILDGRAARVRGVGVAASAAVAALERSKAFATVVEAETAGGVETAGAPRLFALEALLTPREPGS